ncbi:hypothetical protein TIFTF001_009396 [Ficus carica]|uniref:Uncharacterized protein n=1 Tax=Ficus carica TaxID=3494 RepID=A0AA87ZV79_FICCA|nr:hypothetical protein TIFTF001_009396 [Ficus carica]
MKNKNSQKKTQTNPGWTLVRRRPLLRVTKQRLGHCRKINSANKTRESRPPRQVVSCKVAFPLKPEKITDSKGRIRLQRDCFPTTILRVETASASASASASAINGSIATETEVKAAALILPSWSRATQARVASNSPMETSDRLSSEGTFATDAKGCRGKSSVTYWKRQARAKAYGVG